MSHPAAQPYYDSLFAQYASWGLDFIKVDCIFSGNYHESDIIAISQAIQKTGRNIVYSLSPGSGDSGSEIPMVNQIGSSVNMYRITGDFWDCWNGTETISPCLDGYVSNVIEHFSIIPQFNALVGAVGLNGKSWPDPDMLPLGFISDPNTNRIAFQNSSFTNDETMSIFTLWSIARAPLIFGGVMLMEAIDPFLQSVLTNDEVIQVNQNSTYSTQISATASTVIWMANSTTTNVNWVAFFNLNPASSNITFQFNTLGYTNCDIRDCWAHSDLGTFTTSFTQTIMRHGTGLYKLTC